MADALNPPARSNDLDTQQAAQLFLLPLRDAPLLQQIARAVPCTALFAPAQNYRDIANRQPQRGQLARRVRADSVAFDWHLHATYSSSRSLLLRSTLQATRHGISHSKLAETNNLRLHNEGFNAHGKAQARGRH